MRANPSIDFIVAYFHQCAYSTCSVHANDGGIQKYWAPVFDQYQVDLVIQGHNHVYERTDGIIGGQPTGEYPIGSTINPTTQGTTYVTAGSGGKSLYSFPVLDSYYGNVNNVSSVSTYVWEPGATPGNPNAEPVTVDWSRVRYTGYALLVVDVNTGGHLGKPSLSVKAIMEDGATLIDQFSIVR